MLKIREYAKAIAALLGAVATFLVSVNAPEEWSIYLGSIVAILTGVATFGVSNKTAAAPADHAINAIQETVERAVEATSEVDRVRKAVSDMVVGVPVLGPLAEQALKRFRL
jgi:thiol:disulfide interchange protein